MKYKVLLIAGILSGLWLTQDSLAKVTPLLAQNSSQVSVNRHPSRVAGKRDLAYALRLAREKKYADASRRLFRLSYMPQFARYRMQIKYALGLMLQKMGMPQLAAFQYISVVKDGNNHFIRHALEKLSFAADELGDDSLLNYAISRVRISDFPAADRDMLYVRIGEYQMRNTQYVPAARSFSRVRTSSPLFAKAKYQEGLALAEAGNLSGALRAFDQLIAVRQHYGITDKDRVAALMGRARILYQAGKFDDSIQAYRDVPKDSSFWYDTLFESSWAMVRAGKFRAALSNFHSLHSPYYENNYLPESLLLRAIVYLYICKYNEMDKVLNLFNRTYKPVYRQIDTALKSNATPTTYFNTIARILRDYKKDPDATLKRHYLFPYMVAQNVSREGDFHRSYEYIVKLIMEKRRILSQPPAWKNSALGHYAVNVINTRIRKAKEHSGKRIRYHIEQMRSSLVDLFEQAGFIRYEMFNGQKEDLKKKIAGRDLPDTQIGEETARDYYIQNGYQYWPFSGEYWLDELGNYHYVGTQSCH